MRLEDRKVARRLRAKGWTLQEIAAEVGAGKGLVSIWVRDVQISKAGSARLAKRHEMKYKGFEGNVIIARRAWSEKNRVAREGYREEGRIAARRGDPRHALACALYWAEGSKTRCNAVMVNSDMHMLKAFLDFCRSEFGIESSGISFRVSGYTNIHPADKMVKYWVKGLGLKGAKELRHNLDDFRYKSRGVSGERVGKLPYGMCTIYVQKSTRVAQHIYGAIEVYGGSVIHPNERVAIE